MFEPIEEPGYGCVREAPSRRRAARRPGAVLGAWVVGAWLAAAPGARAATVPTGFVDTLVAQGLTSPAAMAVLPDGRVFVAQQDGQLKVIKNDALLSTNFITVTTDSSNERGLLGVAVDANFTSNQYVYLYYTATTPTVHNKLVRVTANGDVAVAGSEVTLADLPDVGTAIWHMGGAIHFGNDGKLYLAVGDHQDTSKPQVLTSPFGKILRFDPNGNIPTDNPFYGSTTGINRAIWALGLRNPFTFAIQPSSGGGRMYINDVGNSSWEEVNLGGAGFNFGWPNTEGATSDPAFKTPAYTYNHSVGCAVVGGDFYNPTTAQFPSTYVGKYFFGDFCNGKIRYLDPANNSTFDWASGVSYPVDLRVTSSGAMYYLARGQQTGNPTAGLGKVYKITYTGTQAPQISMHPESVTVYVGDPATFSIVANGATGYQWQRYSGGVWSNVSGATNTSYTLSPTATSDNGAKFRCIASNSYGTTYSAEATLTVTTNRAPTATISEPLAGTTYAAGEVIRFSGSGSDPEDGTLGAAAFTWVVDFHHETHTHPHMPATSGVTRGTFTVPSTEDPAALVWYRVYLTVTDSGGRSHTVYRDIRPRTHISDMTPTTSTNGWGPAEKDMSNGETGAGDGATITLDGIQYPKGLGVHAPSDTRYALNGTCTGSFIADVGVDDEAGSNGSMTFEVWLDGVKVFDSGVMTGTTLRKPVQVSVAGKNELKLITTTNGDPSWDHGDWAGARVTGCGGSAVGAGTGTGLKGEYYDNMDLTTLKVTRTDSAVNFNWGSGSPDPSVAVDTYSVRWTGKVEAPATETVTFYTRTDDGVRLWVNNVLIIDKWINQGATEWSGSIALTGGQKYDIKMEYYENGGLAVSELRWSSPSIAKAIVPKERLYPPAGVGTGSGLLGQYYDNSDFTSLKVTRTDATVNFNWGTGSPDPTVAADTYSARWTGKVEAPATETVTFYTTTDDGVRLWVNNVLLIDKWIGQAPTEWSGSIALTGGQKYDIKMEYYENTGGAVAELRWSSPTITKAIIPKDRLYPATPPAPPAPSGGTGLYANYYQGKNFETHKVTRTDATVDFAWGNGSPDPSIPIDGFSVRWSGQVQPSYTETYTFYTQSDDGVRLWVNGVQLVNNWTDHGSTENSGTIALTAGQKYSIRMEFYENAGLSEARLKWSSPSQAKQAIPQSALYPTLADGGHYVMRVHHTHKHIGIEGNVLTDGGKLQQQPAGTTQSQHWQIVDIGGGYVSFINRASGKYMDVAGASTADGATILQWTSNGQQNQQWQMIDVGSNHFKLVARHSGKSAGIAGASTADNAFLEQQTYTEADHQKFCFIKVP